MNHVSAHRELQDAVQQAEDRARSATLAEVLMWLEERKEQPDFAAVLVAFKSDWIGTEDKGAGE